MGVIFVWCLKYQELIFQKLLKDMNSKEYLINLIKQIPLNLCKKITKEVLIGLEFIHDVCGVIHTDLKPENVLL